MKKLVLCAAFLSSMFLFVASDVVAENGICLEQIKLLEICLQEAGQGQGWCNLRRNVREVGIISYFALIFFSRHAKNFRCLRDPFEEDERVH